MTDVKGTIVANDNSFDVVSKVEVQEVKNAIDQAQKEVNARFDLKNSKSTMALEGQDAIQLASQDEYTLKAITDILQQKLVKRGGTDAGRSGQFYYGRWLTDCNA